MSEHETLAAALAAFQAELPTVRKGNTADAGTYQYKYADLADVSSLVLPLLGRHGLSFSATPTIDDAGRFVLDYALRHAAGDQLAGKYPLPNGSPQQVGSAITYARRYALCSVTGVAPGGDDDDGAEAKDTVLTPARPPREWDPIEQDVLVTGFLAEIEDAKTQDDIASVGSRVKAQRSSGELSPGSFAKLTNAAAAKRAELNGAAA